MHIIKKKRKRKRNELKNQNPHLTNQREIYDLVNDETLSKLFTY